MGSNEPDMEDAGWVSQVRTANAPSETIAMLKIELQKYKEKKKVVFYWTASKMH